MQWLHVMGSPPPTLSQLTTNRPLPTNHQLTSFYKPPPTNRLVPPPVTLYSAAMLLLQPPPPPPRMQHITFFEEGEPLVDGEPGDLKFIVRTIRDGHYERRGHDLMMNMTISLVDALTGFSVQIEHLDGHKVTIAADAVTKPGDYKYIKGEGMPIHGNEVKHGDLWVLFTVAFPAVLSEEQKSAVRTLFPAAPAA